jgi:catechol 2,3-dioxygenase-like lactoylglutathione lyase family enzyme
METTANSVTAGEVSASRQPRFSGMSHVSMPCRDLEESKIFYAQVMGGELVHEIEGFVEFRIEDIIIGLSEQSEGWTGPDDEYPHYAIFVEPEDFLPMVAWLRQKGVTTSEPWTRDGIKGLLYFRDPAGNLFEMYCPKLKEADSFVRGAKQGGSYAIDFAGLNYQWNG